jgi:cell division protein FtsQ
MITMGKKRKGARRVSKRRPEGRFDFFLLWFKRFGIALGLGVLAIWLAAWLWLSGSVDSAAHWTNRKIVEASAEAGFTVKNVLVEGRIYTDPEVLLGLVDIQKGDPLLDFDPGIARSQIERISWVKSVLVERRFPDTVYVGLIERNPLALCQKDKKLYLIDEEGRVLTEHNLSRFSDLIMVSGEDAPIHALELVRNLQAESALKGQIESAQWIGERRWNLKTAKGVEVKLPADDIGLALKRLAVAHMDQGLLDKTLEHIDLRDPGRIIIQTAPGKVQELDIANTLKAGYSAGDDI